MWSLGFKQEFGSEPIKIEGAVEIRQKGNRIYMFPITAQKLLKVAYVHRRDPLDHEGYQRIVQPKKLDEVREYLVRSDGLVPNSIIVNLIRGVRFKPYKGFSMDGARVGRLFIPSVPCSAWVVDGQHRLMAFCKKRLAKTARGFTLCVVGFRALRRDRQARLFLTINETQKRIPASLQADLHSVLYPAEPRGAAALVVKELSKRSPFKDQIATKLWGREPIKLANFTDSIRKSNFVGLVPKTAKRVSRDQRAAVLKILRRFFVILWHELGNKDEVRKFVFGNNGIAVMLRVLRRAIHSAEGRLTERRMRQGARLTSKFQWGRALSEGIYSSEGDRQRLADRIMVHIAKKCRWFIPPPKHKRHR